MLPTRLQYSTNHILVAFFIIYKVDFVCNFYDPKVTYGNLDFYYYDDFHKATYSPNILKISTRLCTVPMYAPEWATSVAHIPWISQ